MDERTLPYCRFLTPEEIKSESREAEAPLCLQPQFVCWTLLGSRRPLKQPDENLMIKKQNNNKEGLWNGYYLWAAAALPSPQPAPTLRLRRFNTLLMVRRRARLTPFEHEPPRKSQAVISIIQLWCCWRGKLGGGIKASAPFPFPLSVSPTAPFPFPVNQLKVSNSCAFRCGRVYSLSLLSFILDHWAASSLWHTDLFSSAETRLNTVNLRGQE